MNFNPVYLNKDEQGTMFPKTILPFIIVSVGLVGNALILVVVCGRRAQRNAFMTCLGDLAITDTMNLIGYFLSTWLFKKSTAYTVKFLEIWRDVSCSTS